MNNGGWLIGVRNFYFFILLSRTHSLSLSLSLSLYRTGSTTLCLVGRSLSTGTW